MDWIVIAPMGLLALMFGYMLGREAAKGPSEAEMIERIVQARLERKLAAITKEDVNKEIDNSVDRLVEMHR